MQAVSKQGYISPLILSVGIFVHQTTRSKVLLDVSLLPGLCDSYAKVIKIERSATVTRSEDFLRLISLNDDSTRFFQWVAHNFDFNEDTLTGKNTTRTTGIISWIIPKSDFGSYLKIPRRQTNPTELLQIAERSISLTPYKLPLVSMLSEVKLVSVQENLLPLDQFLLMDTLWLYSTLFTTQPPNREGFISQVVDGHFECTTVVFNPMVLLNQETNESVYSTMLFLKEQVRSAGMCCATLTFDQPLYLKANKIK